MKLIYTQSRLSSPQILQEELQKQQKIRRALLIKIVQNFSKWARLGWGQLITRRMSYASRGSVCSARLHNFSHAFCVTKAKSCSEVQLALKQPKGGHRGTLLPDPAQCTTIVGPAKWQGLSSGRSFSPPRASPLWCYPIQAQQVFILENWNMILVNQQDVQPNW